MFRPWWFQHRSQGLSIAPDAWWKADSLSLNDGDAITTWEDSSGNGYDVTQATAGSRPTWQTNELNGQPAVRFDGTDDQFNKVMASSFFAAGSDLTIFIVQKPADSTSSAIIGQDGGPGPTAKWFVRHSTPSGTADANNWHINDTVTSEFAHSTGTYASGSWHLNAIQKTGQSYTWHTKAGTDGTTIFTVDFPVNSSDLTIGYAEGTDWYYGDIAEIIVYKRSLTAAERTTVFAYLADKYAL